jgi:hypothetical protein
MAGAGRHKLLLAAEGAEDTDFPRVDREEHEPARGDGSAKRDGNRHGVIAVGIVCKCTVGQSGGDGVKLLGKST